MIRGSPLIRPENAAALNREASASWGLDPFALVEAAGRSCAAAFLHAFLGAALGDVSCRRPRRILACAGPGNNGADALVMLRALLMPETGGTVGGTGAATAGFTGSAAALLSRRPGEEEKTPRSEAVKALRAMGVPVYTWNETEAADLIGEADLIIDGIAGTGLRGALEGIPLEMAKALNKRRSISGEKEVSSGTSSCTIVSVDIPSGGGSGWKPGLQAVCADYTLAVEPFKTVLYTPAFRPYCGEIIPVRGIFPRLLMERYLDGELLGWKEAASAVPPVLAEDHKYRRGLVEIRGGSPGFTGAPRLAALGASAAGAGLVRLVVEDGIYPLLAGDASGIMVCPASSDKGSGGGRKPEALLLGPGWGTYGTPSSHGAEKLRKAENSRREVLAAALEAEREGTLLVLDAGALKLLGRDVVFHGGAILTPHAGELEALSGIPAEELLSEPDRSAELAVRYNAVILFKSHVMTVFSPGKIPLVIDGMDPSLGAGGSGDFLAGLCAGIAGRIRAGEKNAAAGSALAATVTMADAAADAATAAAALLSEASSLMGRRFYDPAELAAPASCLAGEAWLGVKKMVPGKSGAKSGGAKNNIVENNDAGSGGGG